MTTIKIILLLTLLVSQSFAVNSGVAAKKAKRTGIMVYAIKQEKAPELIKSFLCLEKNYLNVREKTGKNDGADVEMFLRFVGLNKGFAWCMAFVQFAFHKAMERNNIKETKLFKSAGVIATYNNTKIKGIPVAYSRGLTPGAIMIFKNGATPFGHVATVLEKVDNKFVKTIEGNTGPETAYKTSVAAQRDGSGVFIRVRPIVGYPGLSTIGFLIFE